MHQIVELPEIGGGREEWPKIVDIENQLLQRTHELEQLRGLFRNAFKLVIGEKVMPILNMKALDVAQKRVLPDSFRRL